MSHGRAPHRVCISRAYISWACTSWACTSRACTSWACASLRVPHWYVRYGHAPHWKIHVRNPNFRRAALSTAVVCLAQRIQLLFYHRTSFKRAFALPFSLQLIGAYFACPELDSCRLTVLIIQLHGCKVPGIRLVDLSPLQGTWHFFSWHSPKRPT